MYEALVARVRYHIQKANFMGLKDAESTRLLNEAADAIEELQRQTDGWVEQERKALINSLPRWIPVTERLPKYGDWVLGIGPKHGYHICEYRGITHFPYSGDSPWFSAKGRSLTITHWMPLPEPPKEE